MTDKSPKTVPSLPDRPRRIMEHWQLFEAIANHVDALVWSITPDGVFTFVNGECEIFFRSSAKELIGKQIYDFMPEDLATQQRDHDKTVLAEGRPLKFEEEFLKDDGGRYTYLSVKFPMHDASGKFFEIGCVAVDIADKKKD
jgi:PAS domain S-box-containing protein